MADLDKFTSRFESELKNCARVSKELARDNISKASTVEEREYWKTKSEATVSTLTYCLALYKHIVKDIT